ncbi:hypothetical protein KNT65_gp061 [Escherichia phage EcS1]|uniref:Uncharacterized protein n=1 Tax=Escherichia phage EcS1 TaxID=2083276 RepID=A0A2Z5ZBZ0_9CAUD|nr:hypothetical protein KNT65_gp061 [Escherichia phage EcS1]BBC78109.1 hypothetical protein [Escherichia phage EcS1]
MNKIDFHEDELDILISIFEDGQVSVDTLVGATWETTVSHLFDTPAIDLLAEFNSEIENDVIEYDMNAYGFSQLVDKIVRLHEVIA